MARWKLKDKHYINLVQSSIWERREVSRESGKEGITRLKVPTYLDPDNPGDCNYRDFDGLGPAIIVCHPGKGERRDLEFEGPPTPDMEPIDAEAEEISRPIIEIWKRSHPIESLGGTYTDAVIQDLNRKVDEVYASRGAVSPTMVSVQEFNELKKFVTELAAENKNLRAGRRV